MCIRRNTEVCKVSHRKLSKTYNLFIFFVSVFEQTAQFFDAVPFFSLWDMKHFMDSEATL